MTSWPFQGIFEIPQPKFGTCRRNGNCRTHQSFQWHDFDAKTLLFDNDKCSLCGLMEREITTSNNEALPWKSNEEQNESEVCAEVQSTSDLPGATQGREFGDLDRDTTSDLSGDDKRDSEYLDYIHYAIKLGYTEEQLKVALANLPPHPKNDELVGELVKLGRSDKSCESYDDEYGCAFTDKTKISPGLAYPSDFSAHAENSKLRTIVIDGSNIAMSHGKKEVFDCMGIKLAVEYFRRRGHDKIVVFIPQWRKEVPRPDSPIRNHHILEELEKEKLLVYTPSRRVGGRRVVCYDDRYIIRLAAEEDGIVVSNDNYRDLINEDPQYKKVIEERLLMYSFVNDRFMPPEDPLGRHGPTLENFLRKEPVTPKSLPPLCPYLKKCTYGNKCKYYHPERGNRPHKSVTERMAEAAQQKMQEVKERPNLDDKDNLDTDARAVRSKGISMAPDFHQSSKHEEERKQRLNDQLDHWRKRISDNESREDRHDSAVDSPTPGSSSHPESLFSGGGHLDVARTLSDQTSAGRPPKSKSMGRRASVPESVDAEPDMGHLRKRFERQLTVIGPGDPQLKSRQFAAAPTHHSEPRVASAQPSWMTYSVEGGGASMGQNIPVDSQGSVATYPLQPGQHLPTYPFSAGQFFVRTPELIYRSDLDQACDWSYSQPQNMFTPSDSHHGESCQHGLPLKFQSYPPRAGTMQTTFSRDTPLPILSHGLRTQPQSHLNRNNQAGEYFGSHEHCEIPNPNVLSPLSYASGSPEESDANFAGVPSADVSSNQIRSGYGPVSHHQTVYESGPTRSSGRFSAEIPVSDPRSLIYRHLSGLYPEQNVRTVMNRFPKESRPHVLAAYLAQMSSR